MNAPTLAQQSRTTLPSPLPGTLRVAVGTKDPASHVRLRLVRGGCWAAFLGDYDLPGEGALDVFEFALAKRTEPITHVDLIGAPAACLLPALWLRTIWLDADARMDLHWSDVQQPGADPREPLAAHLCCSLVSCVHCSAPEEVEKQWGIQTGEQQAPGPATFDLLTGLIDQWDLRFVRGWLARTREAFERCLDRGKRRIALYGAGTHTRALGPLLVEPVVDVACIIDDNPASHGRRLWGYEIVSRERAVELGVQAVVLSANSFEDKLWANCGIFRERGIDVLRLYTAGE